MKRAVVQQIDQLKAKLNGYVALLVYRYANLCIEADPLALLPIQVLVEGEMKKLEEVAQAAVHEKYHFIINPIFEEDLYAIGLAIEESHPEFKQEIKTWDGYEEGDPAGKYIFCTMPEVNKERHDIILQAVDALYDECKAKMDLAEQYCTAKLAVLQADSSAAEKDKIAEYVKQVIDQYTNMRETNHDDKTKQVEDAYAEYEARQEEKKAQEDEQKQEQGNPMQMMMDAAGNVPQ